MRSVILSLFILFTIDIVGATNYADIDVIQRGIRRSDGARRISITRQERNFTQLKGMTDAKRKHLLNDLEGLAQDRYDIDVKDRADGSLFITLRKLAP